MKERKTVHKSKSIDLSSMAILFQTESLLHRVVSRRTDDFVSIKPSSGQPKVIKSIVARAKHGSNK